MKNTKIICGFPGNGKTTLQKRAETDHPGLKVYDLDPSDYSGVGRFGPGRTPNDEYPDNYFAKIYELLGQVDLLMLTGDPKVIDRLVDEEYRPILVYPTMQQKPEYMQRYLRRSSDAYFAEFMDKHFEKFIQNHEDRPHLRRVVMQPGQYLSDVLPQILKM